MLDAFPYVWLSLMIDGTESRGENRQVNLALGLLFWVSRSDAVLFELECISPLPRRYTGPSGWRHCSETLQLITASQAPSSSSLRLLFISNIVSFLDHIRMMSKSGGGHQVPKEESAAVVLTYQDGTIPSDDALKPGSIKKGPGSCQLHSCNP